MRTETPPIIHLKDYRPSSFLIDEVYLAFTLSPKATKVTSQLKMRPNPLARIKDDQLVLDGEMLKLKALKLDGTLLNEGDDFEVGEDTLTIFKLPSKAFTLEVETVCNPEANKSLSGLYRSSGNYCTQCEAEGFRRITYYLDRPDVMAVFTVRLEAPVDDCPVLLSNGNLQESGAARKEGHHYTLWHDPHPKPSYLFALVGGDLASVTDSFTTASGREVELGIYVEKGKEDRCEWAMDSLKRSMKWDEERFGREYDLDVFNIVAVSDFNMGAMENKGLNIFNDKLILALPDTATDNDYMAIESVIAHEYFHNWTGNRITCRDWFQLCLKEGLTVYRDQEFSADERNRTVMRIMDVRRLKATQFPEDGGPLAHPVRPEQYMEINNFYTATVYQKGGELCRMIETIVGTKGFRRGMDLYFKRHDGEAATVEDFVAAMADANKVDLTHFARWYSQSGTPELIAKYSFNEADKTGTLSFEQVTPPTQDQAKKQALHIPVRLGFVASGGRDKKAKLANGERIKDDVIHVTESSQSFKFKSVTARNVPSILRDFSAPVNLTIDYSEKDLYFLAQNDANLFNRWQAAQTLLTKQLLSMIERIRDGKAPGGNARLARLIGKTVLNSELDAAYRAVFLSLPTEADLIRAIGDNIDPTANGRARKMLSKSIGKTLREGLIEQYEANQTKGAYSPDSESEGKRSLQAACLGFLTATELEEEYQRACVHYNQSKNMTDAIAALRALNNHKSAERDAVFQDFHDKWVDDHLVIDKWFGLQAMCALPATLKTVRQLLRHEKFNLQNPNKVRAVLSAFAGSNPIQFNRPDGKGYELLAKQILKIDRFNPQIAARLCGAFRSWQKLEPQRQAMMKAQLEFIANDPKLSKDSTEIVKKILG
ncbi:MAG: aminopeptidase N [Rhodomicrobium sp.]|nr:MAG: aminopeptidase N [Rhodomicrobium sp.]